MTSKGSPWTGAERGSVSTSSPGFIAATTGYLPGLARYSAIHSTASWPARRKSSTYSFQELCSSVAVVEGLEPVGLSIGILVDSGREFLILPFSCHTYTPNCKL